jgi:uncharacterized protein YecE (DUF72 family)
MADLYIGTSGYYYPEWRGVFYPPGTKEKDFLAYYAAQFNAIELNYTYYQMPREKDLANMAARTAGKLRFSVKANEQLTHNIDRQNWPRIARAYKQALRPLTEENALLSVLLQFPQSYHYTPENRRYLAALIESLEGLPLAAEFRSREWQIPRVYEGLNKLNTGCCVCDTPALDGLPRFIPVVTGNMAYIRFHGRNKENWYSGTAVSRYDYLYSDDELRSYVPAIKTLQDQAKLIQIFFNNHAEAQAAINARQLKMLLDADPRPDAE